MSSLVFIALVVVMSIMVCGCTDHQGMPAPTSTPASTSSTTAGLPTTVTTVQQTTAPPAETSTVVTAVTTDAVTTPSTPSQTPSGTSRADMSSLFYPSGWMGDTNDIEYAANSADSAHSGPDAIKIHYSAEKTSGMGWAGIYWLYPDNNWGTFDDGRDLSEYTHLTFWVKGAVGGEKVEFKVGGVDGTYRDSLFPFLTTGVLTLSTEWEEHSIALTGADLSRVMGGFCWVSAAAQNPSGCTIYLDDIYYE